MALIPFDTLQPADVILYRVHDTFGRLIRLWDDSEFSHAGLYLDPATQGGHFVGEALLKQGIIVRALATSIADSSPVQASRLEPALASPAPVLAVAKRYLDEGNRYAIENIFMLVILCLVRRIHVNPWLDALLRTLFDTMAKLVSSIFNGQKHPMICSEFVFRCYQEAGAKVRPRAEVVGGVQAGSLLDRLMEQGPMPAYVQMGWSPGATRNAMDSLAGPVDEAALEYLISRYLGEAEAMKLQSLQLMDADLEVSLELRHSVELFAASLAPLSAPGAQTLSQFLDDQDASGLIESMRGYVADFVTPGDVERCKDFVSQGNIR